MSRLDTLLLFVLVACALSVVNATYQQRHIFIQLEMAQSMEHHLTQDWSRLQYEQSAASKTSRIEDVASSQLKMSDQLAGRTQYITVQPAASAAAGASAAPGAMGAASDAGARTASAAAAAASAMAADMASDATSSDAAGQIAPADPSLAAPASGSAARQPKSPKSTKGTAR